jgi:sulfate permease, SulP family
MLGMLVVFSGLVGVVAMPTLAALLIYGAVVSVRRGAIGTILRTRRASQIVVLTTFVATLLLPVRPPSVSAWCSRCYCSSTGKRSTLR